MCRSSNGTRSRARAGCRLPDGVSCCRNICTRLDAGTGAFQAQVLGRGANIGKGTLEFSAHAVVVHLAEGSHAVLDQVSGALALTHTADRWTLAGRHLRAVSQGRKDPDSTLDASWRENDSGMLELGARASYLHAEALLPLVGLMPQKDIRERLRDLAPTGEWFDMQSHPGARIGERSLAVRCACEVSRYGLCARGPRPGPSRGQRLHRG